MGEFVFIAKGGSWEKDKDLNFDSTSVVLVNYISEYMFLFQIFNFMAHQSTTKGNTSSM